MKTIGITRNNLLYRNWLLGILLAIGLLACEDNEDSPLQSEIDESDVAQISTEHEMEAAFEDLDLISVEAHDRTEDGSIGGRSHMDETDMFTRCATITHDKEAKTITIDFGDGCEGPDGKFRSGIIFIQYTQRMFVPGAELTITLENYTVNGLAIEGTKNITNVSTSFEDPVSFHKQLIGGKITWPDGSFATREVDKTFTWIRGNNPLLDELHVEGGAEGVNRRGVAYQVTILSKIIWKRACRVRGVCVPVQGLKLIERRDHPDVLLDFGDGECDTLITVTKNGSSRVIEVDC